MDQQEKVIACAKYFKGYCVMIKNPYIIYVQADYIDDATGELMGNYFKKYYDGGVYFSPLGEDINIEKLFPLEEIPGRDYYVEWKKIMLYFNPFPNL